MCVKASIECCVRVQAKVVPKRDKICTVTFLMRARVHTLSSSPALNGMMRACGSLLSTHSLILDNLHTQHDLCILTQTIIWTHSHIPNLNERLHALCARTDSYYSKLLIINIARVLQMLLRLLHCWLFLEMPPFFLFLTSPDCLPSPPSPLPCT